MKKNRPPLHGEYILKTVINRGVVCYPTMKISLNIARDDSIKAVLSALDNGEKIFIVHQMDSYETEPTKDDIYEFGVIATIEAVNELPLANSYQLVARCEARAEIKKFHIENGIAYSNVLVLEDVINDEYDEEIALAKLWDFAERFMKTGNDYIFPNSRRLKKINSLSYVVDFMISHVIKSNTEKLELLKNYDAIDRCYNFQKSFIKAEASKELDQDLFEGSLFVIKEEERKFLLREKLRLIQNELYEGSPERKDADFDSSDAEDDDNYYDKVMKKSMPAEIREKLLRDVTKLNKMHFGSAEANVLSSYLDVCLELPWEEATEDSLDVKKAREILEKQHYGLKKVKERIIEYLSVKLLNDSASGQIICLVGAPGVGKTSIASSVAEAMGKKFARVSLGGVRDEAEIRGHRKTYVGSMPGRIINAIINVGVNNPLILLDELDKMSSDFRGDPASALLEVLDGEQNCTFRDHYVEMPFDLSKCFFIATANTLSTVPKPLLDRMEIIELESYTDVEKLQIAKRHLVPKQMKKHGLKKAQISFTDGAIKKIIESFTREAGVRNLEREIASVLRKCAKIIVDGETEKIKITNSNVAEFLDIPEITPETIFQKDTVGCVNGLAWTSVGGELMKIEVVSMDGNGKLELTGSLGAVMKESAMAALSYIRKHSAEFGIDSTFSSKKDIHIHVPEGAVPKDGPSAGIAITTALISELTGKKIKRDVAMTGEITLTGRVLPIGGLKEKTMAAYKAGVVRVILPADNKKDILKLDDFIKEKLEFKYVSDYSEVISLAFAE